jgi:hypothetical protein
MLSDPPVDDDASVQENIIGKARFLWHDVTRRPRHKATGENRSLMVVVRHTLHATIFTGKAGYRISSILWPDLYDELALSQFIGEIWKEQRVARLEENAGIGRNVIPTELPIPEEGRQVCNEHAISRLSLILTRWILSSVTLLGNGAAMLWPRFGP